METTAAPTLVPDVPAYVYALQKIDITEKQKEMLRIHYASPCRITTARDLAQSVGFPDYGAANLQYGLLGSKVADALGIGFRGVSMLVVMARPGTATNTEWIWVLRENVVLALEELGWVEKSTHLFYPQGPYEETFESE
jgi:hypothetical protein